MSRQRFSRELRDLIEVLLVPCLAALLPWPIAFRIFRRLASWGWLYQVEARNALQEAAKRGWAPDAEWWRHARKLTTLVDHADLYLARTRGDTWMDRYLDVQGHWPAPGEAAILLTFHWGAGMWGLRHAGRAGLRAHALAAPLEAKHFAGRSVLYHYLKFRTDSAALALTCPLIDVSSGMRPLFKALQQREQVLAVIDVPADQVAVSQPLSVLGMDARVPTALLRLAIDRSIPVFVFAMGVRMEDGRRFLRIRRARDDAGLDLLLADVFLELEKLIREDPPAWHLWGESERFFRP